LSVYIVEQAEAARFVLVQNLCSSYSYAVVLSSS
jgi:hypothetical protein